METLLMVIVISSVNNPLQYSTLKDLIIVDTRPFESGGVY